MDSELTGLRWVPPKITVEFLSVGYNFDAVVREVSEHCENEDKNASHFS